jgi:glyoxylate reductase
MSIRCREVYMTREIMEPALSMLSKTCNVTVNRRSRPASKVEIIKNVADKDAILCTVSVRIDAQVMDAAGTNIKLIR